MPGNLRQRTSGDFPLAARIECQTNSASSLLLELVFCGRFGVAVGDECQEQDERKKSVITSDSHPVTFVFGETPILVESPSM